jgi:hypothetical protein
MNFICIPKTQVDSNLKPSVLKTDAEYRMLVTFMSVCSERPNRSAKYCRPLTRIWGLLFQISVRHKCTLLLNIRVEAGIGGVIPEMVGLNTFGSSIKFTL